MTSSKSKHEIPLNPLGFPDYQKVPYFLKDAQGWYVNPDHVFMWPDPDAAKPRIPVWSSETIEDQADASHPKLPTQSPLPSRA